MLKINCKGKRTVGKANNRINVGKNRFKKLKLKKEIRKKKKKEISTELQKPKVDSEVYDSNKICD